MTGVLGREKTKRDFSLTVAWRRWPGEGGGNDWVTWPQAKMHLEPSEAGRGGKGPPKRLGESVVQLTPPTGLLATRTVRE